MTKQICIWLSLLTLLLASFSALPVFAQDQKKEQTYIIKKGDTLWGISERFINDPYYWPNLWSNNPEVTNPHLIYPGQEIRIYDGRVIIVPTYTLPKEQETAAEATAAEKAPQPEAISEQLEPELETVFKTGGGGGFITSDAKPLGIIVDSVDDRTLLTQNDMVFLRMEDISTVNVGDTYGIYRRGNLVIHPSTKETYGNMMYDLGTLQITGVGNGYVTARIDKVFREVERGAELYPYTPQVMEISLKKSETEVTGYILSAYSEKLTQGQHDVVFVDLGAEDGLWAGNMLYITRPRTITEKGLQQADAPLPDDLLGAAVIIETRAKTSAALILKSVKTIFRGDNVMTIVE